ncbi:MAG: ketol-acid reductoisomerase [SAR202 cluster bacterium]|nr:ketol-acid reductoisomerase [SAR202 cluster bacterium]MDP6301621.1 ketol-acid reductoisomerase [SAR202 cluster bacterium]MDP7102513.1 ketol-acid reductoisomerase [SAR202 cluster bacterium]MDP7223843.1 ketol-acid reductoisomerase [SAR202 cluster bacterium]MDP7413780.1 ketol-acid reductoisomerase [SAR202 cluster bacterium]
MATMYYESDADMSLLENKKIGIIGYGSQGHAHALNLKESGLDVQVGLYEGSSSKEKAEAEGLKVGLVAEVAEGTDVIMLLIPDHIQSEIYRESVLPHLLPGKTLMFAHGFNIHYDAIKPPESVDVSMVAPKAPGHRLREVFTRGSGVPGLLAVHQDPSGEAHARGLAYARGIGCTRAGVLDTTFKEETETDLFGEQAVLCGGVAELVKAAFDTLVDAGYQPESAYFECMHELKLIVDLFYQGGLEYMRYSVSDTAEYGDYTRGPRVIDDHVKENMSKILADIQDGSFAREWITENDEGRPTFNRLREENAGHAIENIGKELRGMMSFLKDAD